MSTEPSLSKTSKMPAGNNAEVTTGAPVVDLRGVPVDSDHRVRSGELAEPNSASNDERNEEFNRVKQSTSLSRTSKAVGPTSSEVSKIRASKPERVEKFGTLTENAAHGLELLAAMGIGRAGGGVLDDDLLDFMLSMFREEKPRDAIEAMLLTNVTLAHIGNAVALSQMWEHGDVQRSEAYSRISARMSQGLISQLEALSRYRSKGQASFSVGQVTVEDGGRAIVGPVHVNGV